MSMYTTVTYGNLRARGRIAAIEVENTFTGASAAAIGSRILHRMKA